MRQLLQLNRLSPFRVFLIFALLVNLSAIAQTETSEWKTLEEYWYVIELDGKKAGYAHEILSFDGEKYKSETNQLLRVMRGRNDELEVSIQATFFETKSGDPVKIIMNQKISSNAVQTIWTFNEDSITQVSQQGSRKLTNDLPLPEGVWFMPNAAGEYEKARRKADVKEFAYRAIDVSDGLRIVNILSERTGEAESLVISKVIPVSIWKISSTPEKGGRTTVQTLHTSKDDVMVFLEDASGPWKMHLKLSTKEEALDQTSPAPEILIETFIRPDKPIRRAHKSKSATYHVKVKEGEMQVLPTAGAQSFELDEDKKGGVVTVSLDQHSAASEEELADEALLKAYTMVNSEDTMIIQMAESVLADVTENKMVRSETLRNAVYQHISSKGLSEAFASASETIRSQTGDCTEHAVLLCALLRSDGIPARVASGLIYADRFAGKRNIFGWHMWTQALINGNWVDLDATIGVTFSAAHILTGTSSLENGAMDDQFSKMISLMGNLEINVVEVEYK